MATKKKATPPRKPLIDHKGVTDVPPLKEPTIHWIENRLNSLVPDRWWQNAAAGAKLDLGRRPVLYVTAQVAEVLQIGIDRLAEDRHTLEDQLRRTQERTYVVDEQLSWTRRFLTNARERLQKATSATLVDDALAVVTGIETVLAEERP